MSQLLISELSNFEIRKIAIVCIGMLTYWMPIRLGQSGNTKMYNITGAATDICNFTTYVCTVLFNLDLIMCDASICYI